MGYRIIPASLAIGLTTNEAYTYFCLLAKSDYNTYISHVKLETLSQLTGISKTDYESDESFLTAYKYHPGFNLYETPTCIDLKGVECHFLPFYAQDVWLEKFAELPTPKSKTSILFSHTAVQGSINNDGKVVNNKIPLKLFSKYGKVMIILCNRVFVALASVLNLNYNTPSLL